MTYFISDSWFPNDINQGKTEYLFFMLAILMFLNFVLFIYVASYYKYHQANVQMQENTRQIKTDTNINTGIQTGWNYWHHGNTFIEFAPNCSDKAVKCTIQYQNNWFIRTHANRCCLIGQYMVAIPQFIYTE